MFSSHTYIAGGTFTQHVDSRQIQLVKGSFERLEEAASPAAFHNSGDRRDPPKCYPNTRVAVLDKIMHWILGLDPETRNAFIMWLHGPAGSGKSAIAQSIAEWAFDEKNLLASYFFSRFDSSRNHPRSLIATISYQAAFNFSGVRTRVLAAIDADPFIFTRSLITQIRTLVVEPLQHVIASGYFNDSWSKRLIIIDGLDECDDRDGQVDILRTIAKALQDHHLPLIFLVTSRPEHDITNSFNVGHLREISTRLALDNKYQPSSDIKLFLQAEFSEIKDNHPFKEQIPPEWPTEDTIWDLVEKSSGQFIYAATVIKFVKSNRHRPATRLDIALGLRPTAGSRDMPFAELDALYHCVFSCVEDIEAVLQILAFHILLRPSGNRYCLQIVEDVLSLQYGDIRLLFCDIRSVINFEPRQSSSGFLSFLHASLEDFLLDKSRSKELYIDASVRHTEFAKILFPHHDSNSYSADICAWYLLHALPNELLREKILNLSIPDSFRSNVMSLPSFLKSIRDSFDDAQELYTHHLQSFDRYAVEQLKGHYYSEMRLTALVAVVSLASVNMIIRQRSVRRKRTWSYTFDTLFYDLFQLNQHLKHLDHHGLHILEAMTTQAQAEPKESYLDFLRTLFSDKTRSGIYAPDAQTYAIGAIHLLKYIRDRLSPKMPRYYKIRRDNPWKCRRKMALKREAYKRTISNTQLWQRGWIHIVPIPKKYGNQIWRQDLRDRFGHIKEACYYSMHFLAGLLEKAGGSEELINLAQKYKFGLFSRAFRDETRVAKQAIKLYLERMDEV